MLPCGECCTLTFIRQGNQRHPTILRSRIQKIHMCCSHRWKHANMIVVNVIVLKFCNSGEPTTSYDHIARSCILMMHRGRMASLLFSAQKFLDNVRTQHDATQRRFEQLRLETERDNGATFKPEINHVSRRMMESASGHQWVCLYSSYWYNVVLELLYIGWLYLVPYRCGISYDLSLEQFRLEAERNNVVTFEPRSTTSRGTWWSPHTSVYSYCVVALVVLFDLAALEVSSSSKFVMRCISGCIL